jgi:hypothetical protein
MVSKEEIEAAEAASVVVEEASEEALEDSAVVDSEEVPVVDSEEVLEDSAVADSEEAPVVASEEASVVEEEDIEIIKAINMS